MDAARLEAFVTVVERESFTRAAVRLNLTQPTVTARVKSLEVELGVKLLERLHRSIQPTSAGAQLLPLARDILRLTKRAQQVGHDDQVQPSGRVVIGSTDCLTNSRLLLLIEYLYLRYPALEVRLRLFNADDSLVEIRKGNLDCAFFIDGVRDVGALQHRILCPESLSLLASPEHDLGGKDRITRDDLRQATWLQCDNGGGYHTQLMESLGAQGGARPRTFVLDSIYATRRSVANGVGVAIMPSVAARDELASGSLVELSWSLPFEVFTQVAWRRDSIGTGATTTIIDAAMQIIDEDVRLADTPTSFQPLFTKEGDRS